MNNAGTINNGRYIAELRAAIDRARGRIRYCRGELNRMDMFTNPNDVMADRPRAKLVEDLRKAEEDAGWAAAALEAAQEASKDYGPAPLR
jgi:hypothetical protein